MREFNVQLSKSVTSGSQKVLFGDTEVHLRSSVTELNEY